MGVTRRQFLEMTAAAAAGSVGARAAPGEAIGGGVDSATRADWLARWQTHILGDERNRYCDKESGEELGWLVSPFLEGFYYGYLATKDARWIDRLVDWGDAWTRRSVVEPDGFPGWPKRKAAGTGVDDLDSYDADSLLGEAMALRPLVLMAARIRKDAALTARYGDKAGAWIRLAEQVFEKWDARGAWRETDAGGIWVVLPFGLDRAAGRWTDGYTARNEPGHGFSHPNNKANHDARWHLALYDATGKAVYRQRAEKWFRLMKSRLQTRENGKYFVWNYWAPAGPWDYKEGAAPKHWVGVHPNGAYYEIDVLGMVEAFEHGLVFTRDDIQRLIATNRDFMWNQRIRDAQFQRIDGEAPAGNWKKTPGVLWTALLRYDAVLRRVFIANHDPAGWGGLSVTPWFLSWTA